VENLINKIKEVGIFDETDFIIFSEYGFYDVTDAIPINKILRDKGLLQLRTISEKEYIDFEYSQAFAMVDHQVAHIFLKDSSVLEEVKRLLEQIPGIDMVCGQEYKKKLKIDHQKSGDLIAISKPDKWFSYYWWYDEKMAPSFTKTVDIHRKPGYDPLDLFIDMGKRAISTDTKLIKGSHGRPSDINTGNGLSAFIFSKRIEDLKYFPKPSLHCKGLPIYRCTELFDIITKHFRPSNI
jgi:predicted AlkP superfamily pyrophosphatase or phosphodiesterase